jgi:hypothetical protein
MNSHVWERRAILVFLAALVAVLSLRPAVPMAATALPLAAATALLGRVVGFYFPVRRGRVGRREREARRSYRNEEMSGC